MKPSSTKKLKLYSTALLFCAALVITATGCKKAITPIDEESAEAQVQADGAVAGTDSMLQVKGRFLTFPNGDTIILHGVNVPVYHSGYVNDLAAVAAAVKSNTKSNTVRFHWYSRKVVKEIGNPPYYTNAKLDAALKIYAAKKIIPVLTLADLTAHYSNSIVDFNRYVVPFWTDSAIVAILRKHQNHLIINLANEWGATWAGLTGPQFVNTYGSLIKTLRSIGINNLIMVDAPNGGSNSPFMIANGAALINQDPLKNVILSVHTYWTKENGTIVNCPGDYTSKIHDLYTSKLPFVLGEVSDWSVANDGTDYESTWPVDFSTCYTSGSANQYAVNYDAILTEAYKDKIGFIAWTWYQDGLYVRNIYDQDNGTSINTSPNAGSWPADMLSTTKSYGLKNPRLNKN